MAGRHKQFEEAEVLEKAMQLFWKKGYEATSTEELLHAMEINKGSLYNTFKSKKELFVRVVDFFGDFVLKHIEKVILSQENRIEGIKHLFRNICRDTPEDRERGCFLGNAVSELSNIDSDMERRAVARLRQMEDLFSKYLQQSKDEGYLKTETAVQVLALHLVNLWNGLYVTLRMSDMKELRDVIDMNLKVLD